eukprot:186099_1
MDLQLHHGSNKQESHLSDDSTEIAYRNTNTNTNNNNNNTINNDVDNDVYDDETMTNGSRNDTHYSCTISARRAIQHLVPNYYCCHIKQYIVAYVYYYYY